MKNKEMLRKIYYENKAINRNMQRLVNIGLIGILGGIAKEAKASDDPKAKILVKAGMVMIRGFIKGVKRLRRCHTPNGGIDYP